jgi:hypothetical protein
MNEREQEHELERNLRELRDQVGPPPHLRESIVAALRAQPRPTPGTRRPWARIAIAAALAVVATVTVSIWFVGQGNQERTAEQSLAGRLELVRDEVESIISALEADRPQDARRLEAEFDRVISSLTEVADQVAGGRDDEVSQQEFVTLMDEQLRLVELAVSLQIAGDHDRE